MSGIIDYFPLLEGGPARGFPIQGNSPSLPLIMACTRPLNPSNPPSQKNKSDADKGWASRGEWLHSPMETLSTRSLFNVLGNEKTFPAVCALPSQQILFQEAPSLPSPPCSSWPAPHWQPPLLSRWWDQRANWSFNRRLRESACLRINYQMGRWSTEAGSRREEEGSFHRSRTC